MMKMDVNFEDGLSRVADAHILVQNLQKAIRGALTVDLYHMVERVQMDVMKDDEFDGIEALCRFEFKNVEFQNCQSNEGVRILVRGNGKVEVNCFVPMAFQFKNESLGIDYRVKADEGVNIPQSLALMNLFHSIVTLVQKIEYEIMFVVMHQ